jgi:hypothetical protein
MLQVPNVAAGKGTCGQLEQADQQAVQLPLGRTAGPSSSSQRHQWAHWQLGRVFL